MQRPTPTPPQGPAEAANAAARAAAKAAEAAQAAPAIATGGITVPTTRGELEALRTRREVLNDQLEELTARRGELTSQRASMSLLDGAGHDARIREIDARSATLERQIFQSDEAIAQAMALGVGGRGGQNFTISADDRLMNQMENRVQDGVAQGLMIAAAIGVSAMLFWRGFRRFIWKRKKVTAGAPVAIDYSVRLEQLQRSMDVIAIEVERISEAQRYSAKLLKERVPEERR